MCIFTGNVRVVSLRPGEDIAATCIFGRVAGEEQLIVYSMGFAADTDVAMVLPIPAQSSREDAVRFVDLHAYEEFFREMRVGFPPPPEVTTMAVEFGVAPRAAPRQKLVVHDVGDFEGSFVPSISDFDRLEERFRLAPDVWDRLPQYRDYGFVVFKLRAKNSAFWGRLSSAKPRTTHPMAFWFRTRMTSSIFFPTVHIHDGAVHERAVFDHDLYLQDAPSSAARSRVGDFQPSFADAGNFLRSRVARDLVDLERHCHWQRLRGMLTNRDTVVPLSPDLRG